MADPAQQALAQRLRDLGRVIVAFSGGVDSSLLAVVATQTLGENALCVTAASPFHAAHELATARAVAARYSLQHRVVETPELADPAVAANPPDRCYHCKKAIFSALLALAQDEGYEAVCDGTNLDDEDDYRPGRRALRELGIESPLLACGLDKAAVRRLSRELDLPTAESPPAACLASRIPYGEAITAQKLAAIEAGEAWLRERGLVQCRLRHHGKLARIEVPPAEIARLAGPLRSALVAECQRLGFPYVTLDLAGYRTGSLNEVLPEEAESGD